jgi:acyl carrier protein
MSDIDTLAIDVSKLLEDILNEAIDPTAHQARLVEDYGANSMDVVDIVERLERHFEITIPNNDIGKLMTFGDVITYVAARSPSAS